MTKVIHREPAGPRHVRVWVEPPSLNGDALLLKLPVDEAEGEALRAHVQRALDARREEARRQRRERVRDLAPDDLDAGERDAERERLDAEIAQLQERRKRLVR